MNDMFSTTGLAQEQDGTREVIFFSKTIGPTVILSFYLAAILKKKRDPL